MTAAMLDDNKDARFLSVRWNERQIGPNTPFTNSEKSKRLVEFNISSLHYHHPMMLCIIIFLKSSSDMLFFVSAIMIISLPTRYLNSGLLEIVACSIVFATSSGGVACSTIELIDESIF
jgi:hypothetical protein